MVDMSRYNKLRINPDRYNYDLATNLPLRRTFWRIADKTVLFDNKTYCILAMDVENFHLINKWYGRETGDELLIEIGEALKNIDAGYGTISGYMGGDNFCVIFEENDDIINIIRGKISGIVNGYRGHDITRAYFGAYKTADKDITTGEMCDYAYGALEIAKQRPDKDICWYDESMVREQEAEAKLMPEICSAMDNGEFTFYLQPKCILQTGKIIGSEALVRWISPEKGFISPGQFIPLLEKNGFINKLDVYIWDKVCQTIRRWLDEGQFTFVERVLNKPDKKLILFGAGQMLWDYMDVLGNKFPPYFAVDNGKKRCGTNVCGVDVKAPSAILDVPAQERNVVICCMYYDAISAQLKAMGVEHSEFQDRYFV